MIAYFDTSAVVPLLINEPGSETARGTWDEASRIMGIPLIYTETRAALAQAQRARRLTAAQLRATVDMLDERYMQLDLVEIDDDLVHQAGELAEAHGLRGYDAVHLAAALQMIDRDLVLVAGDRTLLAAAKSAGLQVTVIG